MATKVPNGKHPVSVVDVYHALASCPAGMKPVPVADGSAEMRAAPVVLVLHCGTFGAIEIAPRSFAVVPHVYANADPAKGAVGPEQPARLVFHFALPPNYELVKLVPYGEAIELIPDPVPAEPEGIPEHRDVDPGVFTVNPDAINRGLRDTFQKGKPQGPTTKPEGE